MILCVMYRNLLVGLSGRGVTDSLRNLRLRVQIGLRSMDFSGRKESRSFRRVFKVRVSNLSFTALSM